MPRARVSDRKKARDGIDASDLAGRRRASALCRARRSVRSAGGRQKRLTDAEARYADGHDEGHELAARNVQVLDELCGYQNQISRKIVGLRQVDRDVVWHAERGES